MVEYTCEVCDRVFAKKAYYNAHKRRKRPCKKDATMEEHDEKKVDEVLVVTDMPVTNDIIEPIADVGITKPFLKWVGGKTQILDDVLAFFPTEMANYYEPFLGGGSVLLGLLSRVQSGMIRVTGTIYAVS